MSRGRWGWKLGGQQLSGKLRMTYPQLRDTPKDTGPHPRGWGRESAQAAYQSRCGSAHRRPVTGKARVCCSGVRHSNSSGLLCLRPSCRYAFVQACCCGFIQACCCGFVQGCRGFVKICGSGLQLYRCISRGPDSFHTLNYRSYSGLDASRQATLKIIPLHLHHY